MTIHERHQEWLRQRALDPQLAAQMGVETLKADNAAWLVVPYREGSEVINRKWRMTSEKRHKMDQGAPLALWNADCLRDPLVTQGKCPVIITEGEWDALAVIQAEFQAVVSVPNGAPHQETADLDTAKRYDWVDRHADDLRNVTEFILAVDADQAGQNLRSDLVALLGADRCRFVQYPEGCKDANDVLVKHNRQVLAQAIFDAKPMPVQGLYQLDDFPERGEVRSYPVGIPEIEHMLAIVPGTLTVLTGYANMGKSTLMNAIMANAIMRHFPICVASFETDVKPILRDGILSAMLGCDKSKMQSHPKFSPYVKCLHQNLMIISQNVDEDMEMDLEQFLDLCRIAVKRHGVKMIVLDPWNELEHKRRRDETETDYIGRAIRSIKRFAKQYDVAFWVVAHPTKPQESVKKIPALYDISGSANWANKADYGLTYHRPDPMVNAASVIVSKVRMGLPGERGKIDLSYNFDSSRFEEILQSVWS